MLGRLGSQVSEPKNRTMVKQLAWHSDDRDHSKPEQNLNESHYRPIDLEWTRTSMLTWTQSGATLDAIPCALRFRTRRRYLKSEHRDTQRTA